MKKLFLVSLFFVLAFSWGGAQGETPKPQQASPAKLHRAKIIGVPTSTPTATLSPTVTNTFTDTPTPQVNPSFLINAGWSLINSFTINAHAVTMVDNSGNTTTASTLISSPSESEFFFQVMYRNRYPWTLENPVTVTGGIELCKFTELKFGTALGASVTTAQAIAGSGEFFGEASFDLFSVPVATNTKGLMSNLSISGLYGATTNKLQGALISYGGLGFADAIAIPSNVDHKRIEVLVAYYPFAFVDEPLFNSPDPVNMDTLPATVMTRNGFYPYEAKKTGLLQVDLHYPFNNDHFFTVEGRFHARELYGKILEPLFLTSMGRSQLDSWSIEIGITQSFSSVGAIFNSALANLLGVQTPTPTVAGTDSVKDDKVTSTPTPTPSTTPVVTVTSTPTVTATPKLVVNPTPTPTSTPEI